MKERQKTRYVQDQSQVPAGYVAMRDFGVDGADYKAVARAQKNGLVRAAKLVRHEGDLKNGFVWVHKGDAETYLRSLVFTDSQEQIANEQCVTSRQTASLDSQADAASLDAALSMAEMRLTLGRIESILERLAVAVESIATQPQTAHDRLVATVESNGFHN